MRVVTREDIVVVKSGGELRCEECSQSVERVIVLDEPCVELSICLPCLTAAAAMLKGKAK